MGSQQLLRQISEKEKELEAIRTRQQVIKGQKVPQRRFGAGVTPKKQQLVIAQKKKASQTLSAIRQKKTELSTLRTKAHRIADAERHNEDIRMGKKVAFQVVFEGESRGLFGLENARQRQAYCDWKAFYKGRKKRSEMLTELKGQGLSSVDIKLLLKGQAVFVDGQGMSVGADVIDMEKFARDYNAKELLYVKEGSLTKLTMVEKAETKGVFDFTGWSFKTAPKKDTSFIEYLTTEPKTLSEIFPGGKQSFREHTRGGFELAKFGFIQPFVSVRDVFRDVEKKIEPKSAWASAPFGVIADIIPTKPHHFASYYALGKVWQWFPKTTKTAFTGAGVYGLTQAETPKEYLGSSLMVALGSGKTAKDIYRFTRSTISTKKAIKIPSFIDETNALRQSARVILKTDKGKILYHIDTKTGTYMLPGGEIKKGEIPLMGALRELREEGGLTGIKLTPKGTIKTSEHKHFIFEAIVNKREISKQLKPQAKEVGGFKWIKPPRYTGASMFQPFGRKASYFNPFEKRIVRAEYLYIGSKSIYPEIKPTVLISGFPKEIFMRKGLPTFLTRRVPKFDILKATTYPTKIFGGKPGTFKKFQKTPGIVYGFESRYNIPYSVLKKYSGIKLPYARASPLQIKTSPVHISKGMPKGIKDINTKEVFKVEKKYMKRGESVLFFQPPTTISPLTSKAYIGLTYLGLYKKPKPSFSQGIKLFGLKSPNIQQFNAKLGEDLIATKRARRGSEFESGVPIGTEFEVLKRVDKTYLAGRKVKIFDIIKTGSEKISKKDIKFTKKIMAEQTERAYYYKQGVRPVTVSEVVGLSSAGYGIKPIKYETPPTKYSHKRPYGLKYGMGYKITPAKYRYRITPPKYTYKPIGYHYKYKPGDYSHAYTYTYKFRYTPPPKFRTPPPPPPVIIPHYPKGKDEEGFGLAWRTFVIKGGMKKYISGLRPKGSALRVGAIRARKTLRATFGVEPTGIKISRKDITFTPSRSMFRGYRIVKGKRAPLQNIYIQRRGKRLSARSEVKSIHIARRRAIPKIRI